MGLMPPPEEDDAYQPQGDEESFLFGPTDRPDEPITAGLPFGEGPDVSRDDPALESAPAFKARLADTLSARPQSKELRRFVERLRAGE